MRITMTDWIHRVLDEYIKEGDCCIDATMGKGGDTYYLCSKTGESGKVYAFDVQADALRQTREKLDKHKMNAELILDGHEHMKEYVKEMAVSCIMFNLGYLPGGDHHLATKTNTTIQAVEAGLGMLKTGGIMSICIYSGGDSGFEEPINIDDYAKENHFSTSWFIRNFKLYTGITPKQYILKKRIYNAEALLQNTQYNINEIAQIIGYDNPLYFSRVFQKTKGISPSEYRKNISQRVFNSPSL